MQTYRVPEMSCGHCVSAITEAVHEVDTNAEVTADLDAGTVSVTSSAEETKLREAIREAGYENEPVAA